MIFTNNFFKAALILAIFSGQTCLFSQAEKTQEVLICRVGLNNEQNPFKNTITPNFCPVVNFTFEQVQANDPVVIEASTIKQLLRNKLRKFMDRASKGMIILPIMGFCILSYCSNSRNKMLESIVNKFSNSNYRPHAIIGGILAVSVGFLMQFNLLYKKSRILGVLIENAHKLSKDQELIFKIQTKEEAELLDSLIDSVCRCKSLKPFKTFCYKFTNANLLCPDKNPKRAALINKKEGLWAHTAEKIIAAKNYISRLKYVSRNQKKGYSK